MFSPSLHRSIIGRKRPATTNDDDDDLRDKNDGEVVETSSFYSCAYNRACCAAALTFGDVSNETKLCATLG